MAAGEERYSTLELDNRIPSQPVEQKDYSDPVPVNEKSESAIPKASEQANPTARVSNLEAYHPEYTAWQADEPAALEAYHPAWHEEDQGIIPVITPDTIPTAHDGSIDTQGEEDASQKKKRICGVSRLVFFLLLALAIVVCAGAIIGGVVGSLAHGQQRSPQKAVSSSTVAPSTTASPTSSATASATAIPTYGANVTNCNQNSFQWYAGAQDGKCNQANVKEGFEVIALDGNCTVSHYSDYYCSKNVTASTLYHCYDLVKSFSVDNCN